MFIGIACSQKLFYVIVLRPGKSCGNEIIFVKSGCPPRSMNYYFSLTNMLELWTSTYSMNEYRGVNVRIRTVSVRRVFVCCLCSCRSAPLIFFLIFFECRFLKTDYFRNRSLVLEVHAARVIRASADNCYLNAFISGVMLVTSWKTLPLLGNVIPFTVYRTLLPRILLSVICYCVLASKKSPRYTWKNLN